MTQYVFSLDNFRIDNTRSRHTDTDSVTFDLLVGNQRFPTQTKNLGDLNNGTYPLGLTFGPVDIPNDSTPVIINYQILNSGYGDKGKVLDQLRRTADVLIQKGLESLQQQTTQGATKPGDNSALITTFFIQAGGYVLKFLVDSGLGLILANCDGPVAVDTIQFTGASLNQITAGGVHSEIRLYPGLDSAGGCGDNSDYKVAWSVTPSGRPNTVSIPHVTYRAHVAGIGWMGDVTDDTVAGTTGQGRQMEAISIRTSDRQVTYRAHVATIGWMNEVSDGAVAGTTGRGLRMEAISMRVNRGHIYYRAYVATIGWMNEVSDGAVAGTTGRGLRIEALRIRVTD